MSFTKLAYDKDTYQINLKQSERPGSYHIEKPSVSSKQCYPYPVSVIPQKQGVSVFKNRLQVDVSSELLGITRKASDAPSKKYNPECQTSCDTGYPCGQGVIGKCSGLKSGQHAGDEQLSHGENCFIPAEETRTSNPSCNLRGTGWNRWEWLCNDPQANIELKFPNNVSNRILVKDNHRAHIPNPIDVNACLPNNSDVGYKEGDYAEWN